MDVLILHKTISALNAREDYRARHRRVKKEREATAWMLVGKTRPALPVVVHLVRTSPSHTGLDDDNLRAALKGVRDQIAEWLRVDDGDKTRVRWSYDQRPDKPKRYSIEVTFSPMVQSALPVTQEAPWPTSTSPPSPSAAPAKAPRPPTPRRARTPTSSSPKSPAIVSWRRRRPP